MPELITRNGGQMSSQNFMRLIKQVIPDKIIDGCAITKSGSTIYIAAGHIVAGGALVEVDAASITVSASGELVLRINTADTTPARIIARTAATLTQQDLTNGGTTYEMQLATYVYGTNSISLLKVTAGSSSTASSSSASSGSTSNTSNNTSSNTASSGTTSSGGVLVSKVSSTVSSPTVHYSAKYDATKTGSALSVKLTFGAWLNSSGSKLGTGAKLTVYARLNGGAWQSVVIKKTSDSWSGTAEHSASLTLTATTTASTATIEFYVTRNGSTYSGTAGNLGSSSSPKKYTIKIN